MSRRRPTRHPTPTRTSADEQRIAALRESLVELAAGYLELFDAMDAQTLENRSGSRHGTNAFAPIPLNVKAFDAARLVERDVYWLEDRLRLKVFHLEQAKRTSQRRDRAGVVPKPRHDARHGAGHAADLGVLDALRWIGDALPAAYTAGLAETCEDAIWGTQAAVRTALGLSERTYTLRAPCPRCGAPSLVARPAFGVAMCANPDCRALDPNLKPWASRLGERIGR